MAPGSKLVAALTDLQAAQAICQHKGSIMNWAPTAGGNVRMVGTMFQEIAESEEKQRKLLVKGPTLCRSQLNGKLGVRV